ncbi:MAG: hypothetical protein UY81_C0060G0005 [Candidatus Giovannonibacteria bacterium GW2011_GWA2_53_7]|uniref:Fimbrial assembly family protein n=1 Tax=Candidatus Giovannonibacteria bacterium GW2011_GWA2_53_7 TaxID=1618650 RepID=A0A0G1XV58_9BACT|nr:MAG: hypothetical protein UY81_C0060G0005 [Candidatus Giovannonibacteria bacterium GW2011_GWA2_53_7]
MAPNSPTQFDTSFLPQQPLARVDGGAHNKEPISLSMIVALILFFMMLFATGGVVLYKVNLERRIAAEMGELASKEKDIPMGTIAEFDRLHSRLTAATQILDGHSAFSLVLDILSGGTAVNVGYSKFIFSGADGVSTIVLDGIAPSYAAVYFQGEALRSRPYVQNVMITNPVLDIRTGAVNFQMEVTLRPNALRYGRYFDVSDNSSAGSTSNPDTSGSKASTGDGNDAPPAG